MDKKAIEMLHEMETIAETLTDEDLDRQAACARDRLKEEINEHKRE